MDLHTFFATIGHSDQLNLDAQTLDRYADEDLLGGFDLRVSDPTWPAGSIWEVEGKALYALVRALKPKRVLEIGVAAGCSTSHILLALKANGGGGQLVSLDINDQAGHMIPRSLRDRWTFISGKAQEIIPRLPAQSDGKTDDITLVYEDASHETQDTFEILKAVRDTLTPRLVISHDGMHRNVGAAVRGAYVAAFEREPETALIEPSDCGFAWLLPDSPR